MAESSSCADSPTKGKNVTIIGPSREKNKPKSEDKGKGIPPENPVTPEEQAHDFHFKLKPSIFRHAIGALSNYRFNKSREGLFEVDNSGLSITVFRESASGWEELNVFGLLRLHADYFNHFECIKPVSKMICLERVLVSLSMGKDKWFLSVFSRHGSDLVTFAFEPIDNNEVPRGIPSIVELTDVDPDYARFPDIIYDFDASISTSQLIPLFVQVVTLPYASLPKFVIFDVQEASVQLTVGDNKIEKPAKNIELMIAWRFWEVLRRASFTSEEFSVYNVPGPDEKLMLLFKLSDPDDTMTFSNGTFSCNKNVSCLAFLGPQA